MRHRNRVLVCGPLFPPNRINGVRDVLLDLTRGLAERGWAVDSVLWPEQVGNVAPTHVPPAPATAWASRVAAAVGVPDALRLPVRLLLHDREQARDASALLRRLEDQIEGGNYAAVIACLQNAPVGLAALVTRRHSGAILLSMPDLARELRRRRSLLAARRVLRWLTRDTVHPDLYHPVDVHRIRCAVFASSAWREAAVCAGVPASVAHVIHFGVPCPASLPPATPVGRPVRLLWAGRLSPQKGLPLYLRALAWLRRQMRVRLTVLGADGDPAYVQHLRHEISRLHLADVVTFQPPVARERLAHVFSQHDALLFFSVYRQPVAQLLLRAFASGLVVVAPAPVDPQSAVKSDGTAFCFEDARPSQVAHAIRRAVTDLRGRERVRAAAFELVCAEHSLDTTRAAFHALLRTVSPGVEAGVA